MSIAGLRVPAFRRLVAAWTFSNFGDSTLYLTLAIWAKDLTGSDAQAGLVFVFLGLPVFLAPLTGHVADRFPRRRLVIAANLTAAVGVLSLAFVRSAGDVWIIYMVTFGYGLLTYLTSACASGLVRDLLPDDDLAAANGLLPTIDQGLRLLSPLVGAGLYTSIGGPAVAAVTAAMLTGAATIVATVHMTESPPTPRGERDTFWIEVSAGFRHIRRTDGLARLTWLFAVALGVTGLVNVAIFAVLDQGLHRGSGFFGVIASIQGAGAILGGIASAAVIRRHGEHTAMGAGLAGLAIGIASLLSGALPVVCVGVFIAGIGIPLAIVGYVTLRQRLTPPELQGRVAAAANVAFNGPQTLGTIVGAALIDAIDYRIMIAVMTATLAASAAGVSRGTARVDPPPAHPDPATAEVSQPLRPNQGGSGAFDITLRR